MRKTKRVMALFLAMILALSSLSMIGCGKKTKEATELVVYSQRANTSGDQLGWFAKVMLDKFNVKLKIVKEDDGVFTTRMESGNLGDIIIFSDDNDKYLEAANKGMLFDWNEDDVLTDFGPYIKDNMQKALEKNKGLTKSGKIYGYGFGVASSTADHSSFIYHPDVRWDLYKQLGYPKVSTLEDWVDVLAKMKEICPKSDTGKETYGMSLFNDWDGDSVMFVKATAALYGYEEFGLGLYNVNDQTFSGNLDEGSMYLRCLKFYNTLYQKDLIDPDSLTQKSDGAGEDYVNGGAFFTLFNYLGSIQYNTDKHIKEGKAMYPVATEDQNTLVYGLNIYGGNSIITIGSETQYPELCMEIINWLSTPEGKMTTSYGPKDVTWYYDDNKRPCLTDLGLKTVKDGKTELTGDYTGTYADGVSGLNFDTWAYDATNPDSDGEPYNYNNWSSFSEIDKSDVLTDWRNFTGKTTVDQYLDAGDHSIVLATPFSVEKRDDELDVIWKQVTQVIKDYSWKAIYAKNDTEYDKIVKEMQEKANGYGYDKCCAFMQTQAEKRKAAEDAVLSK